MLLTYKLKKYAIGHSSYWIFSSFIFLYILLRGILVPLAHDETATFFHYIIVGDFIPYHSLFEANNHLLNSLLTYLSYRIFGNGELALRIPNIISFFLYAFFVLKVSLFVRQKWVRSLVQLALLTAVSIVEFFALSRGYGLSMAFFMAWFYYASRFLQTQQIYYHLMLWTMALLAILSNLALLNSLIISIFSVILALTLTKDNIRNKIHNAIILLLFAVPILILSSIYAFDLKDHGALYLGSLAGFAEVTIYSLLRMEFSLYSHFAAYLLGLIVLVLSILFIWKLSARSVFNYYGLLVLLLLGNVIGAILLALLFEVHYPEDRAGMYFIPLFILLIGFLSDLLSESKNPFRFSVLLLVIFPINLLLSLNFHKVRQWKGEAIQDEMFQALLNSPRNPTGPTSIGGYTIFQLNFAYHNLNNGSRFSWMSTNSYPNTTVDYNFLRKEELDSLEKWYKIIYSQEENDIYLTKRKKFKARELLLDTTINAFAEKYSSEYFDLLRINPKLLHHKDILVQIPLEFDSGNHFMQCNLVISATDTAGNMLLYEWMPLHWISPKWDNHQFTMVRSLPDFPANADEMVIYIWNTGKVEYSGGAEKLQFYELKD